MSHLTDFQIQELVYGDCFFVRGWLRRLHLHRCPACRQRAQEFQRARQEQCFLGSQLKEYRDISFEADATMKMPRGCEGNP